MTESFTIDVNTKEIDERWDSFLTQIPEGQYEQTSLWAQVKALDGWKPLRVLLSKNDKIIGGFQILIRSKELTGRIGYISKGPVIISEEKERYLLLIELIKKITILNKLNAVLVHPPGDPSNIEQLYKEHGFIKNQIKGLIQNMTVVIDLTQEEEALMRSIKRQKRQNISRARKSGLKIREGSAKDLPIFYSFMLKTCERLKEIPYPSQIDHLIRAWNLFAPKGMMKLLLSNYNGEDISGLLIIAFGETVNLWRFGWSGKYSEMRPNDLLFWESFRWAKESGYKRVDLVHINIESGIELIKLGKISPSILKSSTFFKLNWGGNIIELPAGYIFFPNLILKSIYPFAEKAINKIPALRKPILGIA